jgi:MFS family permease
MDTHTTALQLLAQKNVRRFVAFRVFFNARFYYPVFAIMFLEFGLTLSQFALLNVVWAVTIVLFEVPSGAMADLVGRKRLLVLAGVLMVFEMAILCFAPRSHPTLLFVLFLVNRVLSGAAEAAASGADEALVYDSLVRIGREKDWSRVLATQMRLQSVGWIVAMTVGAVVYDPNFMQLAADYFNLPWNLNQAITLRFPLFLSLGMALLALWSTLGMKDLDGAAPDTECGVGDCAKTVGQAFGKTLEAGKWVLATPFALVVILAGVSFDHVIRMLLTLDSQYFRLIGLPEASFGLIGSVLAGLGILIPHLAQYLAGRRTPIFVMLFQAVVTLIGLVGLVFFIPYYGLLPMAIITGVWYLNTFMVSHYLNRITPSDRRATVLSFRGLSFNLAYGLIGILYSLLLAGLRPNLAGLADTDRENRVFIDAMAWFPWYFLATMALLLLVAAWLLRGRTEPGTVGVEPEN